MTETSTTYPTRAATESAVRSRFADIAAILGSAKTNAAPYPEGLPSHIDRALRGIRRAGGRTRSVHSDAAGTPGAGRGGGAPVHGR